MHTIPVPHFEDLMLTSGRSVEELEREIRLLLAIKLFELKRVSVGRTAEIAGMGKVAFMDELGRAGVPVIDFGEDQIEHELRDV
jgi:predicted HTH domain antitoxin